MDDGGTTAVEVVRVLDALDAAGCRYWVEGGWGVDALVGRQTRPHRDLDVDIDALCEGRVLATLADLGYVIETDWRPTRVELFAPGRGWVDVHPLQIAEDGSARQADLDGGFWEFPARYYTTGMVAGRSVACVSVEAQLYFHEGYELRDIDRADLTHLRRLQK